MCAEICTFGFTYPLVSVELLNAMMDSLSQIYFGRVHTKTVTDENDKTQRMKFTASLARHHLYCPAGCAEANEIQRKAIRDSIEVV